MGPDDVLEIARRVGPEAVEGDVARAREAARERGGPRRPQENLDVQQRRQLRDEGRRGEEEEAVEDEETGEGGDAVGGGVALRLISQAAGGHEERVVFVVVVARRRLAFFTSSILGPLTNGRGNALAGTRPDRFAAVQPSVETGAQRGQIDGGGAVPVAMAGPEGQGEFRPVEVVGVHEGDVT